MEIGAKVRAQPSSIAHARTGRRTLEVSRMRSFIDHARTFPARADADGYLWFFGRRKQIIVHDGSNISPYEVESALVEHPSVALAAVIGIHDDLHGENVRAYVTLRPDAPPATAADLIAFCRERIGYKAPEEVVFLDEMPLNATGKLDRAGLKQLAEAGLHPHAPA